MSFFRSWKAFTSFTIRGRYRFLAVALEEYFPVLFGRRHAKRGNQGEAGTSKGNQTKSVHSLTGTATSICVYAHRFLAVSLQSTAEALPGPDWPQDDFYWFTLCIFRVADCAVSERSASNAPGLRDPCVETCGGRTPVISSGPGVRISSVCYSLRFRFPTTAPSRRPTVFARHTYIRKNA